MKNTKSLRRLGLFALPLVLSAFAVTAQAQSGGQATLVTTSGDWSVYTASSGKSKVCYALSQPKERLPAGLNRDPGYLFVSFRPAEKINGELAIVVGFPAKEDVGGQLTIGSSNFDLLAKGPNVWLKSSNEEPSVIAGMQKGQSMEVKVTSGRGNKTTDRYSLSGFTAAFNRAKKECGR
ncbi:invasion associated locus B family protein [Microvirga sp. W0021]|uniref:Invasion associated locus B family protein n=1 Tax=Hohaiivirga grylli TaxID=3133970 RepID=A0ABV0BF13_9HYPH